MYLSTLSLWFATWLSVFYCVKIATFSQPLFLWLRQKISGLLPPLLLSSLLVSLLTCFPSVNTVYRNSSMNNLSGNTTVESKCVIDLFSGLSMFSTIGFYSPFIIFIVSSALLITSLWKHSKRMRKAMSSSKDTITEAHVRAIKGLISFIFFYSSYFAVLVIFLIEIFRNDFGFLLLWGVIMAAYPSGHSVILVLGNPKLKKVAVKALHYAQCRLRNEVS
ncbi:taste receptor type 2 member 40-like [Pelodiscus sinensis]|uniref:taste receptor type 2 member 40-like n=1 Tax=Pelodiscus sinensis TaxID=13735 RepID=UPI003F6BA8E6